jgi:hypothetical protein
LGGERKEEQSENIPRFTLFDDEEEEKRQETAKLQRIGKYAIIKIHFQHKHYGS